MKFIDRKGKIFGIINIVDLLVLFLIIGLISVIVVRFNSKRLNANGSNPASQKEEVFVTLYSSLVVPEIAENLKVGDKLVANNSFTSAEIVSVSVEPAAYVSTNSDGEAVLSQHPLWKDVTVVIKDTVNPSSVILKAGNQEVRVGYSFILKTQTVETNCKIRGVEFGSTYFSDDATEDESAKNNTTEDILENAEALNTEETQEADNYDSSSNSASNTASSTPSLSQTVQTSNQVTPSSGSNNSNTQEKAISSEVTEPLTPNIEENLEGSTPVEEPLEDFSSHSNEGTSLAEDLNLQENYYENNTQNENTSQGDLDLSEEDTLN